MKVRRLKSWCCFLVAIAVIMCNIPAVYAQEWDEPLVQEETAEEETIQESTEEEATEEEPLSEESAGEVAAEEELSGEEASVAETQKVISGFQMPEEYYWEIGESEIDETISGFPAELIAYIEESEDAETIAVVWSLSYSYQISLDTYYYEYAPQWDENEYVLSAKVNSLTDVPAMVIVWTADADDNDDPQYARAMGNVDSTFYDGENPDISWMSLDGGNYVHNSRFSNYTIVEGIDVSKYQQTIDWNAVKASGVDFAIVRVGYRGYSTGNLAEDEYYKTNIEGALKAGIKVGVYIFSQAITDAEAIEEANYVLSRIASYNITLPVVIDYEYAGNGIGRLYNANLSKNAATSICKSFCKTVEAAGYTAMVYANKSMLETQLNASELSANYKIWLAHYTTATSYSGDYTFWQYSSTGSVSGINGNVDCNFWYVDLENTYNGVDYSDVYNFEYYISVNSDVAAVYGSDPSGALKHFVEYGMAEGRQAKEDFNVYTYKNRYADLSAVFGSDLKSYYLHYINCGKAEGRSGAGTVDTPEAALTVYEGVDYAAVYNYDYYLSNNPDVAAGCGNNQLEVIRHFVQYGMSEGRQGKEDFNVYTYRNRYPDIKAVYGSDLKSYYLHYINYGIKEGRTGSGTAELVGTTIFEGVDYSAVYDYNYYTSHYNDVKAAYGEDDEAVIRHFVQYGMSEGRQGKEDFNVYTYRNRYPDIKAVYGSDLKSYYLHYINYGVKEGRTGSGTAELVGTTIFEGVDYSAVYDYNYYISQYNDVKAAYGEDDEAVIRHFVQYGMTEGRQAKADFNVYTYKERYIDLDAAYGMDLKSYYLHYINYGRSEGRSGI